jgi:hypothetical protein
VSRRSHRLCSRLPSGQLTEMAGRIDVSVIPSIFQTVLLIIQILNFPAFANFKHELSKNFCGP